MVALGRRAFTLIELLVVVAIISILLGLLLAAVQKARDAANRAQCANNLHQIALAVHGYHDSHGRFPPGCNNWRVESQHDYKFWRLSWMALILPFVEQDALWRQTVEMENIGSSPAPCNSQPYPFNWSYPWDLCPDGTQRFQALGTFLPIYSCPADSRTRQTNLVQDRTVGMTSYLGVTGPGIYSWSLSTPPAFSQSSQHGPGIFVGTNKYDFAVSLPAISISTDGARIGDITDGTSSTLMIGERPPSSTLDFGWWFAGYGQAATGVCDFVLGVEETNLQKGRPDVNACPPGPYTFGPGSISELCDAFHFWSPHSGGANFAFADGSVRFLTYSAAPIMPALATRAGREVVSVPE